MVKKRTKNTGFVWLNQIVHYLRTVRYVLLISLSISLGLFNKCLICICMCYICLCVSSIF
ncbi:unnamed protein product [Tenebrio molitor]|nr:unnamed protein product [Tenebrio molitor]